MDQKDAISSEATESEKLTEESIASTNDLKSKKFIAYIISLVIAIGGFVFVYLESKDSTNFYKFLDFLLYAFIAYVGGNSVEHITNSVSKK
jgi:purine-cytosine permease-like protein